MSDEQQELLNSFQEEVEKCFKIAQKLDALNPELVGSFTGTPSERIERHLNIMQQELNRLQRYDEELTKVMNPDFKDWHENSKECHPEIAAWVITNLWEQLDWAHKEIERLYAKGTSQTGT